MDDTVAQLPLYAVTSQQETVDLAANGSYLTGVRVSFRTRSGALGSVFVPNDQYDPETVKRALAAKAEAMEAVHNSGGEG